MGSGLTSEVRTSGPGGRMLEAAMDARSDVDQVPGRAIRVALVNDYPIVCAGLAALLEPYRDRVEVASQSAAAIQTGADPDVVLYDMFGAAGAIDDVVRASPAKVVVFTSLTDPGAVVEALRAGIAGYVHKGVSPEQLVTAVENAYRSTTPVVHLTFDSDEPLIRGRWPGMEHDLTERQSEIMMLVCRGLTNQEIAEQLHLSINSIKTYVGQAYRKVGVGNRAQAVLWGLREGFLGKPG